MKRLLFVLAGCSGRPSPTPHAETAAVPAPAPAPTAAAPAPVPAPTSACLHADGSDLHPTRLGSDATSVHACFNGGSQEQCFAIDRKTGVRAATTGAAPPPPTPPLAKVTTTDKAVTACVAETCTTIAIAKAPKPYDATISEDGMYVAVTQTYEMDEKAPQPQTYRIYDVATKKQIGQLSLERAHCGRAEFYDHTLAIAIGTCTQLGAELSFYDLQGKKLADLAPEADNVNAYDLSALRVSGTTWALALGFRADQLWVVDSSTGKVVRTVDVSAMGSDIDAGIPEATLERGYAGELLVATNRGGVAAIDPKTWTVTGAWPAQACP